MMSEAKAKELDRADPMSAYREKFFIPCQENGKDKIYLCGNSLGLQPKTVPETMHKELVRWQKYAVEGHFHGENPWYTFQHPLRQPLANIIGAHIDETIFMNGLTVNLHLLLFSFYRPTKDRYKILMVDPSFPSDRYTIASHLKVRGQDVNNAFLTWRAQANTQHFEFRDLEELLKKQGEQIALIILEGVNFLTGQVMDMQRITELGHKYGCIVGFDLAHAVGNVPLHVHDWQVDFAVWCSYKYLSGGPGAVAGCFVHERHIREPLQQLAGWWGNDPKARFKFEKDFVPFPGVDRWQLSNPPIFSLVPLFDSLTLFASTTMSAIHEKNQKMTGYLRELIENLGMNTLRVITPNSAYGSQLSIAVEKNAEALVTKLGEAGIVSDFREPNIVRMAPVPFYNTYQEMWRVAKCFSE